MRSNRKFLTPMDRRSSRYVARQYVSDIEYEPRISEMADGDRIAGVVRFFNPEKGWGFARRDGGQDVFLHANELRRSGVVDLTPVSTGQKIEFEVVLVDGKGPKATNIKILPMEPVPVAAPVTAQPVGTA